MPGNGGGPEGPTAVSALCSKGIFPASSRPPCTKRRLSVRLGGGYSAFSAHSCDILSYLIRFPAACQEFLLPILCAWGILALAEGAGGPVCRPCGVLQVAGQRVREAQGPSRRGCAGQEVTLIRPFGPPSPLEGEGFRAAAGGALTGRGKCPHNRNRSPHPSGLTASHLPPGEGIAGGASPSPTILKKLFRNWVGEALGPPADHVPAATSSETPGAGAGPQQRKFLQGQGPVARREFETPLRFCAPGLFCLTQGVTHFA